MSLNVTLDLPTDVVEKLPREGGSLNADVKEVYVLELFRRGTLSHYELSQALGLDRIETDAFLKRHGVFEGSLTSEDLETDWQTVQRAVGQSDAGGG
jgi:predicted HTH domain antitoxin